MYPLSHLAHDWTQIACIAARGCEEPCTRGRDRGRWDDVVAES